MATRRPPPRLPLLLPALLLSVSHAHLQVANTLGSHMVLQRAPHRAAIYGHADPLAPVGVTVQRNTPVNNGIGVPARSGGGR